MTIIINKLIGREWPEHWRVLVLENEEEIWHDSANTKLGALNIVERFINNYILTNLSQMRDNIIKSKANQKA